MLAAFFFPDPPPPIPSLLFVQLPKARKVKPRVLTTATIRGLSFTYKAADLFRVNPVDRRGELTPAEQFRHVGLHAELC